LGHPAYLTAKAKGDHSMLGKRWLSEDVVGLGAARPACQGQCLIASSPISARRKCAPTGRTSDHRCCGMPRSELCTGATSMRQAMTNEVIQGDEWAAYSTLGRTTATYRGMAYGRRRLGSRSPDSSRGSHAPPGSGGKPRAGRSGIPRRRERVSFRRQGGGRAGARGIWTGRYARCRPPQPDGCQPQSRAVAAHWKAGCPENGHVRFGGGADGKGSQDTSPAAYSTLRGGRRSDALSLTRLQ